MYAIGLFVGAVFAVVILSRIFWLVAKSWPDSLTKVLALDLGAGLIAGLLGAIGAADGGSPKMGFVLIYLAAGALVSVLDAIRSRRKPFSPPQQN